MGIKEAYEYPVGCVRQWLIRCGPIFMQKYAAQTVSWINLPSYLGHGERQRSVVVPIQLTARKESKSIAKYLHTYIHTVYAYIVKSQIHFVKCSICNYISYIIWYKRNTNHYIWLKLHYDIWLGLGLKIDANTEIWKFSPHCHWCQIMPDLLQGIDEAFFKDVHL